MFKRLLLFSVGSLSLFKVSLAITEDEETISMRDANSSRERPRIEAYDMDESILQKVEEKKENPQKVQFAPKVIVVTEPEEVNMTIEQKLKILRNSS